MTLPSGARGNVGGRHTACSAPDRQQALWLGSEDVLVHCDELGRELHGPDPALGLLERAGQLDDRPFIASPGNAG